MQPTGSLKLPVGNIRLPGGRRLILVGTRAPSLLSRSGGQWRSAGGITVHAAIDAWPRFGSEFMQLTIAGGKLSRPELRALRLRFVPASVEAFEVEGDPLRIVTDERAAAVARASSAMARLS